MLLMDREERAAINNSAANTSPHNCALRLATAFSKGTKNTLITFTQPLNIRRPGLLVLVGCIIFIGLHFVGMVDIGHLPHPVLVHLRSFFDLWDAFVLQAVQTGQPYISDHLMFEVCIIFSML